MRCSGPDRPTNQSVSSQKYQPGATVEACLDSAGVARTVTRYDRGETIFSQGDASDHVLYVQTGGVKLSVLSTAGKEAVVAVLGPGDFFGEGAWPDSVSGWAARLPSPRRSILRVGKPSMARLLQSLQAMSDPFISHMLSRNIRIEDDLVVQLLDSSESGWRKHFSCWPVTG